MLFDGADGATTSKVKTVATVAPAASVAVTVSTKVPNAEGVPDMTPVFGSSVIPAGKVADVRAYVMGAVPPAAPRLMEYVEP